MSAKDITDLTFNKNEDRMKLMISDVKKKLSLIMYSLLFSNNIAPLKNSSLDAKNGLIVNLVFVLNLLVSFL